MVAVVSPDTTGTDERFAPLILPVGTMPERGLRDLLRELPTGARRIRSAWAMLITCAFLSAVMLAWLGLVIARFGFSPDQVIVFLVWGPLFCVTVATGVLILHRYPGHRVGWILCLAGFTWITANTTYLYGSIAMWYPDLGLPAASEVLQAGSYYPFGLYLIVVELLLIFPTGRLVAPGWHVVRWLGLLGAFGASMDVATAPLVMNGEFGDIPNPWHVGGLLHQILTLPVNGFYLMFAMGVPAAVSMVWRLRRATGVERAQLRWIAWATVFLVLAYTLHISGSFAEFQFDWWWIPFTIWGLALNSMGIVVAMAILRYRLYDIDLVIHRSILYAALVAIIAALYLALVSLLNAAARPIDAEGPAPLAASLIVAAGVALVAHPLRLRLEGQVNRRLYGERDNPGAVLARLGARLEAAVAPAELLGEVTRTVTDLLRVPHAAVALRTPDGLEVVAEAGVPGDEQVGMPMVYQHEPIGELRVTPRGPGEGFSRADGAVLAEVARQAAVAAYALRVTGDLRLARERLVTAREEERRRLRRDLHDGLGAQLAALTMQATGVRRLLHDDPGRADAELDHLQGELRSAIADIRRLVHGLRPPALDEFGLVAALRSRLLAFETASGGVAAELRATGDDRALPAAVEVAIYRIVEEALTNIARHAAARRVTVTLAIGAAVELAIADDGQGLPARREPGVGVHSMRERSEELGGAFAIGPAAGGGTRVDVTIPLPEGR
jgi:signal transduction histidine kinase